jgi:chemotaxis protein histidine kinase CheA
MPALDFAERIAKVRMRFITTFAGKLQEADAALPYLAGDGEDAAKAVEATYRRFHDMCGIGATLGFDATGQAAKAIDAILIAAFRARRGLSDDELARFTDGLEALRTVGRTELETTAAKEDGGGPGAEASGRDRAGSADGLANR